MSVASRVGLLSLLFLSSALAGCRGCGGPEEATQDRKLKVGSVRPLASGALKGIGGFRQRLESEAKDRQSVPWPIEDVFASLERDGTPLTGKRQQTASPHFARYCMAAHAGEKVQLTVCEHESEAKSDEYVAATNKLERPERRIAKHGQTTLLVRRDLTSDAEQPLVDKILRTFETIDAGAPAH